MEYSGIAHVLPVHCLYFTPCMDTGWGCMVNELTGYKRHGLQDSICKRTYRLFSHWLSKRNFDEPGTPPRLKKLRRSIPPSPRALRGSGGQGKLRFEKRGFQEMISTLLVSCGKYSYERPYPNCAKNR